MADEGTGAGAGEGTGEGTAGSEGQNWLTSIPEEFRGHEVFKGMEKAGDAYGRLTTLHDESKGAKLPEGATKIPNDKSSDEEVKAFNTLMGVPDSKDGYEYAKPNLPDGMIHDDVLMDSFKDWALEAKIPKSAAEALMNKYNEYRMGLFAKVKAEMNTRAETNMKELRESWPGEKFAENTEKALRGFKTFAGDGAEKYIKENGLESDPVFIKVFHGIFEKIGPEHFVASSDGSSGTSVPSGRLDFSKSNMPDAKY